MKIIVVTFLYYVFYTVALCNENVVPEAARPLIARVKETATVFSSTVEEKMVTERRAAFEEALNQITETVDADAAAECKAREGASIDCKIVTMAFDRKNNPEPYKIIDQEYLNAPLPPQKGFRMGNPRFPELKAAHVNERFRLAWEYMLLRPQGEAINYRIIRQFYIEVALAALLKINSSHTQMLYEYEFQSGLLRPRVRAENFDWKRLFSAMATEPSEDSLRRLIRCLESTKDIPKTYLAVQKVMLTTLLGIEVSSSDAFYNGFVSKLESTRAARQERREKWQQVIEQFPKQNLSPDTRDLLQKALDHRPL